MIRLKKKTKSFEPYSSERNESQRTPQTDSQQPQAKQKHKIRFVEEPKIDEKKEPNNIEKLEQKSSNCEKTEGTTRISHSVSYDSFQTIKTDQTQHEEKTKDEETLDIVKTIEDIDSALQSISNNKKKQPSEYRISVNVGKFAIDDINVQLIDDTNGETKLLIYCLKIEPIESMAGNFLKKEFKKEVKMPKNVDINSLETYFYNDIITFTCKYKEEPEPSIPAKSIINEIGNKEEDLPIIRTEILSTKCDSVPEPTLTQQYNVGISQSNSRSILKTNSQNQVQTLDQVIDNIINSSSNNTSRSSSNTNFEVTQTKENNWTSSQPGSQSIPQSSSLGKTVRFDEDISDRLAEEAQEYNSALYGVIRDGYNCLTKDSLENVYLTYFFKLPSCSPADRTQVKVENHSILRLKMIQERRVKDSNTSVKVDGNNLQQVVDDNEKIMFREFSRRCRLPTNLFKFDDSSVSVSFMNDVWVRVEIPIIEFLTIPNDVTPTNPASNTVPTLKESNMKKTVSSTKQKKSFEKSSNLKSETINYETQLSENEIRF